MAFNAAETKKIEATMSAWIERERPPLHIREQLDLGFRIVNQSVDIFETRPHWENATEKTITPVARATYVRARDHWRILWMRADAKLHRYEALPEVASLDAFLKVVKDDKHGCFFG